jgi:prefoldin subunit 5
MKEIEREVQVIENLIRILNDCRNIALTNNRLEEVESCTNDIETCKQHLKKLWGKREQKCFL